MKTLVRVQQIYIDHPTENSQPWLHVILQEVDKDEEGKTVSTRARTEHIHRKGVPEIMGSNTTFIDPLTGQQHEMTKMGVFFALLGAIKEFATEDFPSYYLGEDGEMYKGEITYGNTATNRPYKL
jgi:hypothetical protein